MKILLVSPMPPAIGGISVSCSRLRDRLIADGHNVEVYDMQTCKKGLLRYISLLTKTLFLPFKIAFNNKYDIIHFNISSDWRRAYFWLMQFLFKNRNTVVTLHHDVGETLKKSYNRLFLRFGKRLICVRSGNSSLLPSVLQKKTLEIPAFILPDINKEPLLPLEVGAFVEAVKKNNQTLVVFNGAVIVGGVGHDLYGFEIFVDSVKACFDKGISFGVLIISNNNNLDSNQRKFLNNLKNKLDSYTKVFFCSAENLSLLRLFQQKNVLYVRPTKTDGDSLAVREALACGVDVIASDVSPRPNGVVLYDHSGHGVSLTDVMCKMLSSDYQSDTYREGYDKDFYKDILGVYYSLTANERTEFPQKF